MRKITQQQRIKCTSCLPKRPRQTGQTHIRLDCVFRSNLIRVFPVCYSGKLVANSSPDNQPLIFYLRIEREKGLEILGHLLCSKALENGKGSFCWKAS